MTDQQQKTQDLPFLDIMQQMMRQMLGDEGCDCSCADIMEQMMRQMLGDEGCGCGCADSMHPQEEVRKQRQDQTAESVLPPTA